jgi:hypothetical protein
MVPLLTCSDGSSLNVITMHTCSLVSTCSRDDLPAAVNVRETIEATPRIQASTYIFVPLFHMSCDVDCMRDDSGITVTVTLHRIRPGDDVEEGCVGTRCDCSESVTTRDIWCIRDGDNGDHSGPDGEVTNLPSKQVETSISLPWPGCTCWNKSDSIRNLMDEWLCSQTSHLCTLTGRDDVESELLAGGISLVRAASPGT